jgi:hypothetical protein
MLLAQQRNKTYLWSASLMLLLSRETRHTFDQAALRMKTKGTCCFSAEQAALRMKTKDCLARNLSVHRNVTCKCSHHDIAEALSDTTASHKWVSDCSLTPSH